MENKYPIGGYVKATEITKDLDIQPGHKIRLYGKETVVIGFHVAYNDALEKWETIILTEGRGDPFERSLDVIEVLTDQPPVEADRKFTPEQIEERKNAIECYRDPGKEQVNYELVFIPCEENDPRAVGGYTSYDGRSLCHVREGKVPVQQGAVWVNCSGLLPVIDNASDNPLQYIMKCKDDGGRGNVHILHLTAKDMVNVIREWDYCEWLDENPSPTPSKESDAVEIFEFTEWAAEIAWFDEEYRLWNFYEEEKSVDGQFRFTTKEFYQLFLKQKEVNP